MNQAMIDKMLLMNSEQLSEHMKTLTADELRHIMHNWDLMSLCTIATCEAARRYLAGEK